MSILANMRLVAYLQHGMEQTHSETKVARTNILFKNNSALKTLWGGSGIFMYYDEFLVCRMNWLCVQNQHQGLSHRSFPA